VPIWYLIEVIYIAQIPLLLLQDLPTKTKGSKTPGVLAMYSKTIKDSLPAREQAALINKTAKVPRMLSKRAPSNHTKCDMKLIMITEEGVQYRCIETHCLHIRVRITVEVIV
jgi:hypothetical protein